MPVPIRPYAPPPSLGCATDCCSAVSPSPASWRRPTVWSKAPTTKPHLLSSHSPATAAKAFPRNRRRSVDAGPGGGGGLPPAFQSCGPDTWTAPRWPRSSPSVRTVRTACCRCWGGPPAYLRAVRQSYGMRLKLSRGFTGFGVADRLGVLTPSTTNVGQVPN